eukprot:7592245-Lingulodinium_polyedra.AAC.1
MKATPLAVQSSREAEGVLFDVYLIQAESQVAVQMQEKTKAWQEETKEKGKGHGLGPPFLH